MQVHSLDYFSFLLIYTLLLQQIWYFYKMLEFTNQNEYEKNTVSIVLCCRCA